MPEGIEVFYTAKFLDRLLKNKLIIGIFWCKNSKYKFSDLKYIKLPLLIHKIKSHGKLIIWECYNAGVKVDVIYMTCHLGMTGKWSMKREKHTHFWINIGEITDIPHTENSQTGKYTEILQYSEFFYKKQGSIYFVDPRKFGKINFCRELNSVISKHGPCLLTYILKLGREKLDHFQIPDIWFTCLNNKRISNKPIAEFLLCQKYFSGIGNYLRAEILYLAKISPKKPLKILTSEEATILFKSIVKIMYHAYCTKGPKNGYFSEGQMVLNCYGLNRDKLDGSILTHSDKMNCVLVS